MNLDIGFIILNPHNKIRNLRSSIGSVEIYSNSKSHLCVVEKNTKAKDFRESNSYSETFRGKDTMTSLINTGFKKLKNEWGFVIVAGAKINQFTEKKINNLICSEKDVLYSLALNQYNFVDSSLNGILINKQNFKNVGQWVDYTKDDSNDFRESKIDWYIRALQCQVNFKGVLGLKPTII